MTLLALLLCLPSFGQDTPAPEAPAKAAAPDPTPVVQIKATKGQRFSVIVDGKPSGTVSFDAPMILTHLAAGRHTAEFRTEDNLVIWARGVLELGPSEELVLTLTEGRPVMANGRTGAWRVATSTTTLPRKPVKKPTKEVQ
jgi:hypothetical protein